MPVMKRWIDSTILESHQLHRHQLNLRHVVVKNAAIIPFDGYARPIRFRDRAKIGCRDAPANTVADF